MRRRRTAPFATFLLIATLSNARLSDHHPHPPTHIAGLQLPLSFEANQGQTDARVQFLSRGSDYTLFLSSHEALLRLHGHRRQNNGSLVKISFLHASQSAIAQGENELSGKANYFIGRDPAGWHTNVPTYAKVKYKAIYPGINLVYHGNRRQVEYDFILSPSSNARDLDIKFDGAPVELDSSGDLVLHADGGEVRFRRPVSYQLIAENQNNKHFIKSRFVLRKHNEVGFEVGPYDHSHPLIIDPVLIYSTYLGGSFQDEPLAIAVDSSGSAYVA